MKQVAIIGAGEFGKQVLDIALLQNKYAPVGFIDDFNERKTFQGLDILGKIDDVETLYKRNKFDCLFVAIGYKHLSLKQELLKQFAHIPFATIVHPTSVIEQSAEIAQGVLTYAFAYIGFGSKVCKGSVINVYSYLPHDNLVKECTFLSCGVNMGGKVTIGERSFIGVGSTISDNLTICDDTLIGAGTVVIKDIEESGTYVGCPARKIN